MPHCLRLLHTADWHLGRQLLGRRRDREFDCFLDWLLETICTEYPDILLIAGDVFDTAAPSNRAQNQYYDFLACTAKTPLRHIVIIAGNHDSAAFLDAPRGLLRALNVHVIGQAAAPEAETLLLSNDRGEAEAIVCAVPYLRDRDIRTAEAGESLADKAQKLIDGMAAHYAAVGKAADALASQHPHIPVIGMGHLFAAGGRTADDDGVRDLYVGTLGQVSAAIFPPVMQYVALGHLHLPQKVGGCGHIRYSGSPLPMGFGEAGQQKQVLCVDFAGSELATVRAIPIPTWQRLLRIQGDAAALEAQIAAVKDEDIWIEAQYCGTDAVPNLRERLERAAAGGQCALLRIKNRTARAAILHAPENVQTLQQMRPEEVFAKLLEAEQIPDDARGGLTAAYAEILAEVRDEN